MNRAPTGPLIWLGSTVAVVFAVELVVAVVIGITAPRIGDARARANAKRAKENSMLLDWLVGYRDVMISEYRDCRCQNT